MWRSIAASIVLMAIAIFLIVNPDVALKSIVITTGIVLLLDGIYHIVSYFRNEKDSRLMSFELVFGILEIIVGLCLAFKSEAVIDIYYILLGILIVLESIANLQVSLNLKDKISFWWLILVFSFISIILGVFVILHPFDFGMGLAMLTGIILLVSETLNLVDAIIVLVKVKKISNDVKKIKK